MDNSASRHIPVIRALHGIWCFYRDGFRSMTVGRSLWIMIIAKLIILFLVFKIFFFPDILQRDYDTDEERAGAVRSSLLDERRQP